MKLFFLTIFSNCKEDIIKVHLSAPLITSENSAISLENITLVRILPRRLREIFVVFKIENGNLYVPDAAISKLYVSNSNNCSGYVETCFNILKVYGTFDNMNEVFDDIHYIPNIHFNTFKRISARLDITVSTKGYFENLEELTFRTLNVSIIPINDVSKFLYKERQYINATFEEAMYTGHQRKMIRLNNVRVFDIDLKVQHLRSSSTYVVLLCNDKHGRFEVDPYTLASVRVDVLHKKTWPEMNWVVDYLKSIGASVWFERKRLVYIYGTEDQVNDALQYHLYFSPHYDFIGITKIIFITHDLGSQSGGKDEFNHIIFSVIVKDSFLLPQIESPEILIYDFYKEVVILDGLYLYTKASSITNRKFSLNLSTSFGNFAIIDKTTSHSVQLSKSFYATGNIVQLNEYVAALTIQYSITKLYVKNNLFFDQNFFDIEHFVNLTLTNLKYGKQSKIFSKRINLLLVPPLNKRIPILLNFPGRQCTNDECHIIGILKTVVRNLSEPFRWDPFRIISYDQIPPFLSQFVLRVETKDGLFIDENRRTFTPPLLLNGNLLEINKQMKLYEYQASSKGLSLKKVDFKLFSKTHKPLLFTHYLEYPASMSKPRIVLISSKIVVKYGFSKALGLILADDRPGNRDELTLHLKVDNDQGYMTYSNLSSAAKSIVNNVDMLHQCCAPTDFKSLYLSGSVNNLQNYVSLLHFRTEKNFASSRLDIVLYDKVNDANNLDVEKKKVLDSVSLYFYSRQASYQTNGK